VGRETFQELLFRCAAHRELVLGVLARYGLPADALAVPMAASGCVSDIESPEGGRGLWRLTPAAAKAYHLRVKAQVVDERIDPAKATEAAVRLLEDLHRKTGSWELALAAYRLGPLALLSRAAEVGEGAAFWDLVEAEALPDEVGKFVSKVQAYALILANIGKVRFQPAPRRSQEVTSPLEVPPGTRLGLVARAAASSTTKIRELNPDVIGDRVPDWPGEKFVLRVPKDSEPRARELLPELIATSDHSDECVPHAFDWGRQRFTTAMASRCEQASGGR
jgi:membrane-bound lytic murein transglycosylase D